MTSIAGQIGVYERIYLMSSVILLLLYSVTVQNMEAGDRSVSKIGEEWDN